MNDSLPITSEGDAEVAERFRKMDAAAIGRLPLQSFEGPIRIVDTDEKTRQAVRELRRDSLLGFDTETRPAFTRGVSYDPALIQLADRNSAYIFLLRDIGFHEELQALLSDANLIKSGVAVTGDIRALRKMADFTPRGFVDLGSVAKRNGIPHHGLRGLAARLLGIRISKSERFTNWARRHIPARSLAYAATDAWLGRELYLKMRDFGCQGMLPEDPSVAASPARPRRRPRRTTP